VYVAHRLKGIKRYAYRQNDMKDMGADRVSQAATDGLQVVGEEVIIFKETKYT